MIIDFGLVNSGFINIAGESFEYFSSLRDLEKFGHVYLIRCCQYYKIGISSNVVSRLRAIERAIPINIEVIGTFPSLDVYADEKRLHLLFAEYTHRNEWFKLPKSMVSNRANWFLSLVKPSFVAKQIKQKYQPTMVKVQENEICSSELSFYNSHEDLAHQFRIATILSILIEDKKFADDCNLPYSQIHNHRYNGLYRKTAQQLKKEAGIKPSETPLDAMSIRDLSMNELANTLCVESGNTGTLFDFANDIKQLYEKRMGKRLEAQWQSRSIVYEQSYQTELPLEF